MPRAPTAPADKTYGGWALTGVRLKTIRSTRCRTIWSTCCRTIWSTCCSTCISRALGGHVAWLVTFETVALQLINVSLYCFFSFVGQLNLGILATSDVVDAFLAHQLQRFGRFRLTRLLFRTEFLSLVSQFTNNFVSSREYSGSFTRRVFSNATIYIGRCANIESISFELENVDKVTCRHHALVSQESPQSRALTQKCA